MGKFPSEKHFCSWLGLAPKTCDLRCEGVQEPDVENEEPCRAGIPHGGAIGEAADRVFGSLYRCLKGRLDKAQATVATAHAIARDVYRMLKYKVEDDKNRSAWKRMSRNTRNTDQILRRKPRSSTSNLCLLEKQRGQKRRSILITDDALFWFRPP